MSYAERLEEIAQRQAWDKVREQGYASEGRQAPRRVWAAQALKPELTEQEWAAATRCVRECAAAFDGMRRTFDIEPVDGGSSDYGLAARVAAARTLEGLRQAAFTRTGASKAPICVEWIAQMWTLADIAGALGHYRRVGRGRNPVVDVRTTRPFVRLVLLGMAAYYDDCDAQRERWARAA